MNCEEILIITSDPIIKIQPDLSELILELHKIQPKLHKRQTLKLKRQQQAYIYNATEQIFSLQPKDT